MYFLIIMLGMALGAPQDEPQDMYFNHLNISLGINYKYNGLLYHNIDRVWVVTKVILPKLEDISFPDVKFDADCSFVNCNANPSVKTIIQSMCKSMKLLIMLIKQKEKFYEMAIQSILKEEIPWSLHGKVNSQLGSSNQDPVSAGQRFLQHQGREQKESHYSFYTCYSWLSKNSSQKFKYIPSAKKK